MNKIKKLFQLQSDKTLSLRGKSAINIRFLMANNTAHQLLYLNRSRKSSLHIVLYLLYYIFLTSNILMRRGDTRAR